MKKIAYCGSILAAALLAAPAFAADGEGEDGQKNYYGEIGRRVVDKLREMHVSRIRFDDAFSRRAWTNLVTYYDFDHSVFLQSDLKRFSGHQTTIVDELRNGDVSFGYELHKLYVERLKERILYATNLLARGEWDFTTNETYLIRRKDAPWPETREEAEDCWRRRMKNDVLVQMLNRELDEEEAARKKASSTNGTDAASSSATSAVALAATNSVALAAAATNTAAVADSNAPTNAAERADTPEESMIKRYRQYATVLTEPDGEAVLQHYLGAVCHACDPHTDYMSPVTKDDFDMEMNLTLCGVGAVLSMDEGALKIVEIMPGGPVDRDGRIKEGDKIVGVGQGKGPVEDVMWQPMKKTIQKIRGKKGTHVTLQIVPKSDPSGKKLIELVRDEIKLEDQAATGRVETVVLNGVTNRLGYVYLPGFYGSMDKKPSDPDYRSCALDVCRYLAEFNSQGVSGLVLDLRGNGGGSLFESVRLSALFVPSGPVVQVRNAKAIGSMPIPRGNAVAFRKPMVVIVDRASASASEIVAGHLQDVGRAIVVGDCRTHGKGTVQTVTGLGPAPYGSMKITTARFYRVNGRSTQIQGVASDIHLPSLFDSMDVGEDKLDGALPFSSVLPADYSMVWNLDAYAAALRHASAGRCRDNQRYRRHLECVAGMKAVSERTTVSLEREARKRMMAADRELREDDDDGDEDEGEREERRARRRRNERDRDDVVLDEALNVLSDLVRLNGGAELPQPKGWWL